MTPYGYGYGYGPTFGLFGLIWHVVGIVFVIWVIFAIIRGFGMGRGSRRWMWHTHSALSILNERFAKGEIDQKEYEERKKALMNQ